MPDQIHYPTSPIYLQGCTEADLAEYQHVQVGNTCTFHAISSALRLLIGFDLDPQGLSDEIDHLWWQFKPMRIFPCWAVTPRQQAKIIRYVKIKYNLPIKVQFSHAEPNTLFDLLSTPKTACLVTLLWGYKRSPGIYYGKSSNNTNSGKMPSGHTMLLAAYDPLHHLWDGTQAPWGFVNSWINNGSYLFWMQNEAFQKSWHFMLPFVGFNPLVTIQVVD